MVEKSVTTKVEELSKRVDSKAATLHDIEKQQTVDLARAQGKDPENMRTSLQTDADARSEFSAQTQETELGADENILDFKIEDAEFDPAAISNVPSLSLSSEDI